MYPNRVLSVRGFDAAVGPHLAEMRGKQRAKLRCISEWLVYDNFVHDIDVTLIRSIFGSRLKTRADPRRVGEADMQRTLQSAPPTIFARLFP